MTGAEYKLQLCSIINKEICYGEDNDEKEEDKNGKSEEADDLCLFNLWEGSEDPLPSLCAHQS
jgi:hypothetical protein